VSSIAAIAALNAEPRVSVVTLKKGGVIETRGDVAVWTKFAQ
jgi:hypothetical protein